MPHRGWISAVALAASLCMPLATARAFDESKYPDWGGQWLRPHGIGIQWDQDKRPGLPQQAPLKPEYQKKLEASLEDQRNGGQGLDNRFTCMTNGMPRMMAVIEPIEFIILPAITYINFEAFQPRRIYTDGRDFSSVREEPSLAGYSIGTWSNSDGDGRFDTLEIETRNFKGPRTVESTGIPLADDNQTVVKEKIYLDKANNDLMHNIITIVDNAFTHPWTVDKRYRRERNVVWFEDNCNENNHHVVIGNENYYISSEGSGFLMPARKDQAPPALRYFNQTQK